MSLFVCTKNYRALPYNLRYWKDEYEMLVQDTDDLSTEIHNCGVIKACIEDGIRFENLEEVDGAVFKMLPFFVRGKLVSVNRADLLFYTDVVMGKSSITTPVYVLHIYCNGKRYRLSIMDNTWFPDFREDKVILYCASLYVSNRWCDGVDVTVFFEDGSMKLSNNIEVYYELCSRRSFISSLVLGV